MGDGGIGPDDVRTRTEFAEALTALRLRAGLSVRELARRVGAPSATIGDYLSGRHLPNPGQMATFHQLLAVCEAGEDIERWTAALTRVRVSSDGRVSKAAAPYRGLEAFQADDAQVFFGRAAAVEQVIERLRRLRDHPAPSRGTLAVVGPSGSGKSSLLRAGVLPAVHSGLLDTPEAQWRCAVLTPGADPAAALGRHLDLTRHQVLIVDQFEELFTAGADDSRQRFLQRLAGLDPLTTLVVLGMRADFYPMAVEEPALLPVLQHGQLLLGPMTEAEVRQAIVEPARSAGAVVQDGLVELLLADLTPRTATGYAHDPGALPLLSHALLATWEHARRNELTIGDYRAVGGIRGAVRQTAEQLYADLDPVEQDVARRIFLRLVNVDEATLSRRRVSRDELIDIGRPTGDGTLVERVLHRFVDHRLITADAQTVEVSHEALLTAWPRLSEWIENDRAGLRAHRQLTEAANTWHANGGDAALLLRGSRLAAISEWAADADHDAALNRTERDFLTASRAYADRERLAERRRARWWQRAVAAVAALALLATVFAILAFRAKSAAATSRDQALSREVALEAERLRPLDPGLAAQLAVAAYRISPTVAARGTLIDATSGEIPARLLGSSGPTFVAVNHDGNLVAVTHADDGSVHLYRPAGTHLAPAGVVPGPASKAQMFSVAITPDGTTLAVGGADDVVTLWSITDPAHPHQLTTLRGMTSAVQNIAISSDGTLLAAVGDTAVRQWNIAVPAHPTALPPLPAPGGVAMQAVGYSPDGRWLAAVGANGTIALWPLHDGTADTPAITTSAGDTEMTALAFNPRGDTLATASRTTTINIWSIGPNGQLRQAHPPLTASTGFADTLAFSADGTTLASGANDNTIHTWNTSDWSAITTFNQPGPITSLTFGPTGSTLFAAGTDGALRLWSMPPPQIRSTNGNIFELGYTPNGRTLLTVSSGATGAANLWNVSDMRHPALEARVSLPADFGPAAGAGTMSPDGKLIAVPNRQGAIQLVDVSDPSHPALVGSPLTGPKPLIEQISFSANGQLLAAGDDSGQIHLWTIRDPQHPKTLPTLTGPASMVLFDQFSPNSTLLAAASADKKVWLWDVSDPAHPHLAATLTGFTNYAFSATFTPDSRTLIAGSADHTIRLWDVSIPSRPHLLSGPLTACNDYVYFVSTSPDGHTLATACEDDTVGLWDIATPSRPKLLATLHASADPMFTTAFTPGGKTLAGAGADQLVRFWTYQPTQAKAEICAAVGDPMSKSEWAQYVPGAHYDPPCS